MIKFEKDYKIKIIALVVAVSFFFNSTVYGINLSGLRKPLITSISNKDEIKRFQETSVEIKRTRSGERLLKLFGYSRLKPDQLEMVIKIADSYNEAFGLNKSRTEIDSLANKVYAVDAKFLPNTIFFFVFFVYNFITFIINIPNDGFFSLRLIVITIPFILWLNALKQDFKPFSFRLTKYIYLPKHYLTMKVNNPEFILNNAHEFAHTLKLPNNRLLANAYKIAMLYKLEPQIFERLIENSKGISRQKAKKLGGHTEEIWFIQLIGDIALETIPDPVKREATIRKMFFTYNIREECGDDKQKIKELLNNVYNTLGEKDYKMPRPINENLSFLRKHGKWDFPYGYASIIGYIAIRTYGDSDKTLKYIYRLGQARDSRELKEFEPQGVLITPENVTIPTEKSQPPVPQQNTIDSIKRQPDMAI